MDSITTQIREIKVRGKIEPSLTEEGPFTTLGAILPKHDIHYIVQYIRSKLDKMGQ